MRTLEDSLGLKSSASGALSVFGGVVYMRPFALECIDSEADATSYVWVYLFLPPVLGAACAVAGWASACFGSVNWARVRGRSAFMFFNIYLPLAQSVLQVFNCESLGDDVSGRSPFLSSAPWVSCESAKYRHLLAAAVVALVLWVILAPLLVVRRLVAAVRGGPSAPGAAAAQDEVGFLLLSVENHQRHWWWEPAVLHGRKLLVASFVALLPFRSAYVPVAVLITLLVCLLLQAWQRPYRSRLDNALEPLLLLGAVVVYLGSILSSLGANELRVGGLLPVTLGLAIVGGPLQRLRAALSLHIADLRLQNRGEWAPLLKDKDREAQT